MTSLSQLSHEWFLATSLYDAIDDENLRQVAILIQDKRANPNIIIPDYGITALHLAVGHKCERFGKEVTKLLLQNGGNPNIVGIDGVTPLHVAVAWNKSAVVRVLLSYGADPWLKDENEKNSFHYAYEEEAWDTIKTLEAYRRSKHSKCESQDKNNYKIHLDKVIIHSNDVKAEYKASYDSYSEDPSVKQNVATQTSFPFIKSQMTETTDEVESEEFVSASNSPAYNTFDKCYDWCDKINDVVITDDCKRKIFHHRAKSCTYEYSPRRSYSSNRSRKLEIDKKRYFPPVCCAGNNLSVTEVYFKEEYPTVRNSHVENELVVHESLKEKTKENKAVSEVEELFSEDSLITDDQSSDCRSTKKRNILNGSEHIPFIDDTTSGSCSSYSASQKNETSEPKNALDEEKVSKSKEMVVSNGQKENMKHVSWSGCLHTCACISKRNGDDSSIMYSPGHDENLKSSVSIVSGVHELPNSISNKVESRNKETSLNEELKASNDCLVNEANISIEYKYTDDEEGIEFIAAKMPFSKSDSNKGTPKKSSPESDGSDFSAYDTDYIRKELKKLGFVSGPIGGTPTKKLYLRKLRRIKKTISSPVMNLIKPAFSSELEQVLAADKNWVEILSKWSDLEREIREHFLDGSFSSTWRSGTAKTSFIYLLLDPRISDNLPARCEKMDLIDVWRTFVRSIFYIGKGTRARPYEHLHEAFSVWHETQTYPRRHFNSKINHILEIWKEGLGVVCVQTFHNLIPAEAYTREAAMIDTIGLARLKNEKAGMYYGLPTKWNAKMKRRLGAFLLYRAMRMFIVDNEVQLKPTDVN